MHYLLDSTAVIAWLRGKKHALDALEGLVIEGHVLAVNAISVSETYSGLAEDELAATQRLLENVDYWPIDEATAIQAGAYRYHYARRGITLSVTDMLLAAHAVRRDATFVTGNLRHFPMPEIKILPLEG